VADEQFTAGRLVQQLQQQKQQLEQASEKAAQCLEQLSSQSRISPATSQSGVPRSDVTETRQRDREELPVGSDTQKTDGGVGSPQSDVTTKDQGEVGLKTPKTDENFPRQELRASSQKGQSDVDVVKRDVRSTVQDTEADQPGAQDQQQPAAT